ncbi:MAG: GH3 family domain-containing protein, partial [Polaribacter sp.]
MAFALVNSIISWFLKKRKHQIELFLKYPIDVQEEVLLKLIHTARKTDFGKKHEFSAIKDYKEFSNTVPIQRYESIEPLIE